MPEDLWLRRGESISLVLIHLPHKLHVSTLYALIFRAERVTACQAGFTAYQCVYGLPYAGARPRIARILANPADQSVRVQKPVLTAVFHHNGVEIQ